jgi:hypothetical protein
VQNSTAVFQLNFSNDISFCASISRPNAKPQNVSGQALRQDDKQKMRRYEKNAHKIQTI